MRQALRSGDSDRLIEYQISPEDVHADATALSRSIVDRKPPTRPKTTRRAPRRP